jgi:hypothetical protein
MNFSNFSDRLRGMFPQREYTAPPPPPPASGQQAPVTIVMPGQTSRKVSMPVMILGGSVVLMAMYCAGHHSATVDRPIAPLARWPC